MWRELAEWIDEMYVLLTEVRREDSGAATEMQASQSFLPDKSVQHAHYDPGQRVLQST